MVYLMKAVDHGLRDLLRNEEICRQRGDECGNHHPQKHALPLNLRDQYPDKRPRACRSDCNGAQADRRCLRALLWRKIIAYRLIEGRVDRTLGKSEQEEQDDEGEIGSTPV